jgi:methionyl aminopeptidase
MIYIKTPQEIENIRKAGKLSALIMEKAIKAAVPGANLLDIEGLIEAELKANGATGWFKEKKGYPFVSCLSVNEVWVHGMPKDYILQKGDILSIDLGVKLNNYYTDHCWTIGIGEKHDISADKQQFLSVGEESLKNAISNFQLNNKLGDISYGMQKTTEDAGFSVIREFIGHGVGLKAHEDPVIPCYGRPNTGLLLRPGMVFAVEIMYSMGKPDIKVLNDGWSVCSADNSLTGMFEHTVALTEKGPEILTI